MQMIKKNQETNTFFIRATHYILYIIDNFTNLSISINSLFRSYILGPNQVKFKVCNAPNPVNSTLTIMAAGEMNLEKEKVECDMD